MFEHFTTLLTDWAQAVPLEIFVTVGAVVEEIIAPIPSPLVGAMTGAMAEQQGYSWLAVAFLCALASLGKTFGAWIFYVLGDKAEDIVVPRFGKYIGVNHNDLEHFGQHFKGSWRDDIILFVLRSIPVMPSTPISVVCGILKINMRTFLAGTFLGFYVRNMCFIVLGYTSGNAYDDFINGIGDIESLLTIAMVALFLGIIGTLYYLRRKHHPGTWLRKIRERFMGN